MRAALSVVVIICLIVPSIAGCATTRGPQQIRVAAGGVTPIESNWSRVGELLPATQIALRIKGSQSHSYYLVFTDASGITVLDLTNQTLPAPASRVLRDMASHHPESFSALSRNGALVQDNVRVERDGVFVAGRRVADLEEVVQTFARSDVAEIRGPVVAHGSVVGAMFGGSLALGVGVVPALGGASDAVAWLALIGSVALGGYLGFHGASHATEGIVYRAP